METDKIIKKFVDASIKYGEAIETGNPKKANRYSKMVRDIRKQLQNENQLELLCAVLDNQNDYVRLNIATSLIAIKADMAEATLIQLSNKKGLFAVEAQMFLNEWKKGNIRF